MHVKHQQRAGSGLPVHRSIRWSVDAELGLAERKILRVLVDARGQVMTKQQVTDAAGYEVSGGGFNNALGKLRTLELIEGKGELRASATLVEHTTC